MQQQRIVYAAEPRIGLGVRLPEPATHRGWVVTAIAEANVHGARGWTVRLTSVETGLSHEERWGVVLHAARAGRLAVFQAALAEAAA